MKHKLTLLFTTVLFLGIASYLTASCKKNNDQQPVINVNTGSINLKPTQNSSDSVLVMSNTSWTAGCNADWLTITPTAGTNNQTITVTASQNNTTGQRLAEITIMAAGAKNQIVKVTQGIFLYASADSITIDAPEGSKAALIIKSDTNWTVTCNEQWLNINKPAGNKTDTVTFTATLNPDTATRVANVTVSQDGNENKNIKIKQTGSVYNLSVNETTVTVAANDGSTGTFNIVSDTEWKIENPENWLTLSQAEGSGNTKITVTAQKISISKQRDATLLITSAKAKTIKVNVTQLGIPCGSNDETPCPVAGCNVPIMPLYESLTDNPFLPDPFTFLNGQRMTTKAEWECRSAEIAMLAQEFEYGYKPCTPYESTTGAFADNNITVTVTENGKTVSFNCSITYPSAGSAPYPAIISLGWFCLNRDEILNLGIAIINFPNDDIGLQVDGASRGKGKFYDLHCNTHSAGALMAWAWGVSRLIDALEKTPAANIDTKHLGVTGCSRNGKGALCAGAFDNRIALTIPQESGSGGAANWRVSDYMGSSVQRLTQIVDENCWFRSNFKQFKRTATKLPFDHHMIAALCAPRGLLFIENTSQTWLGNESCWATGNATSMIYQALGIADNMGFSQNGHSDHCGFPDAQIPELVAFVKKFLLNNNTVDTHVLKTDGSFTFDKNKWINWDIPELK